MSREDAENPLQTSVHKALRAWRETESSQDSLLEELFHVRKRRQDHSGNLNSSTLRMMTNQVLLEGLDELVQKDEQAAHILRGRFLNDHTSVKVALDLNISVDQLNRLQRKAIATLTDILQEKDQQLYRAQIKHLEARLNPANYTNLYGVQEALHQLVGLLRQPDAPWLIAIIGLGGIGKTTLADAVTRQVIQTLSFDQVIWLRAGTPPETGETPSRTFETLTSQLAIALFSESDHHDHLIPRIRQRLKDAPHLIVIDNLESEADTQYIFDHLADWGNPSKILITSRIQPATQAGVFIVSLNELTPPDAAHLIRHQATITGLHDLATASDETLQPILHVVGGNPFALKLVVSLAQVLPLDEIIHDLPVGHARPIEQMYRHIYWKAWRTLSEHARALLLVMPLVANTGAKPEQMVAISGLPNAVLLNAIQELMSRSLLEARGSVWDRRYGIHRLTETFLRTEIIDWPEHGA